ncbi:hypothetical protein TEA_025254 [Camellia sinensis var. sinensis]|uniref:non-specific serine/threonine protein kinase n=1 Tax=Camellia sinensis var. sinensis TaxID=542762 RepID=A0A4S4EUA5_CAMSN|nr:hypothetical protein TEA_025254 [Camellia sinensis var. sinensis]
MTTVFAAAVIIALIAVTSPLVPVHGLGGSASTFAVVYGSATVCGIVAEQQNQRIQCWQNNQLINILPNISFDYIAGGQDNFCGVRSGGFSLLCWNPSFVPKRVYYNDSVLLQDLTFGDDQICALTNGTQNVRCWRGETKISTQLPDGSDQFRSISSGLGFSCGVMKNSGRVTCWGSDSAMATLIETQYANVSMSDIVVGGSQACGLNLTGFVVCKGNNDSGQLAFPSNSAHEYSGFALGTNHSCAIRKSNNSVVCHGRDGAFSSNLIEGVSFESIVAGLDFTCGLTTSNFSIICWGPGWPSNSSSGVELPLPKILPGPCVQSTCSDCASNNSPPSRCSTIRRQGSRAMRRQRSGTSSKHADRAEEFSFLDLAAATNNFSLENKLGAGSFGIVYQGKLWDGREVAIKRGETGAKTKKFQEKESAFESELAFLSRLHHKHLVRLVGYCEERDERLLVYEYMKNGALYDHLHDKNNVEKSCSVLNSWKMRIKISLDAARGIEYLHNYAVPPIIHRDIKSSNILLDANWTARVSDFGLSLMGPESDQDYRPMKAAGTVGYIDPEYYGLNVLTAKSDVYGLGVVLLELLTGKRAIFKSGESGGAPISVVDFAVPVIMAGEIGKILDQRVGPLEPNEAEAVELVAYTAMHCVNLEGKDRPTMTDIVANLERALALCDDSHGSISSGPISIVSE